MKVFITHQLDSSDPILDLAPIRNLDSERGVGTIKYKLRSLEQAVGHAAASLMRELK